MKIALKNTVGIAAAILVLSGALLGAWNYAKSIAPQALDEPPVPLTIAVNSTYLGSGLVLIAAANGYFSAERLDVTIQAHTTGRAALASVQEGRADLATVAEGPLVFAAMKGEPVSIVATISIESGAHGVVARKDRGIATAADLKGKDVGATFGTSSHFFIDAILVEGKIPTREVRIVDLKPEQMADALMRGEVDAVSAWEPYLTQAREALGGAGAMISGDGQFVVSFNIAGKPGFVKDNSATMKKLILALLRAERFAAEHPDKVRVLVANATGTEAAALDRLWPAFSLRVRLEQGLLTRLEAQSRWAIRNGYADRAEVPNYLDFIQPDAMAALKPDAVTIIR